MDTENTNIERKNSRTILFDEIIRQRIWGATRRQSIQSRATVLASASTFTAIFQVIDNDDSFSVLSAVFAMVAAVLGVIILSPRKGEEIEPMTFRNDLYRETSEELTLSLMDSHLDCLASEREDNEKLAGLIQTGFAFLVCAVSMTVISILIGWR